MALLLILIQITGSGFTQYDTPADRGAGGPDAYGYRWIDSDTTGAPGIPTYNWIDISGIGTQVTGLGDDNWVGPFPIGFDFPYYWYTVSDIWIGSNGYISFGEGGLLAPAFPGIPNTGPPNNVVAPWMVDLTFDETPGVCYYWTNAAQDTCIIAYHDVPFWGYPSPTGNNTFEIILTKADSSIIFQYHTQEGASGGGGMTVGIENVSGMVGLEYYHNGVPSENSVHESLAVRFYPPDSTTYEAHDIAVQKMMNDVSGGFFLYNGDSIDFWAVVKNTGNRPEAGFDVNCLVRDASNTILFTDTVTISSLDPGDVDSIVFSPSWGTSSNGLYSLEVQSLLSGDMVPPNDSIYVQFRVVTYPAELQYENVIHTGFAWNGVNSGYGARFVPPQYPTQLSTARFNVNSTQGSANITVQIMDDDGPNNGPGTVFYQTVIPVPAAGWYDIDVSGENIIIDDGAFYIGCISNMPSDPYFAFDTLFPSSRQTWEYTGVWAPYRDKETDDVAIHAVIGEVGIEETKLTGPVQGYRGIIALPNPFSTVTAITVPYYCNKMVVYDAAGRLVSHLEVKNGIAAWNGRDDNGKLLNQGIYFGMTDDDKLIKLIFVK